MSEESARNEERPKKSPSPNDAHKGEKIDPNDLSPEEQLRRYEEQLKNDDWGHQPC